MAKNINLFHDLFCNEKKEIKAVQERLQKTQVKTAARFSRGNTSIQHGRYVTEKQLVNARQERMKRYA
ncbi:MAG: hypothetical protein JKX94_04210 [Sneathiella sp.]|nr:hypothetical protein [Sneathiella sp.]